MALFRFIDPRFGPQDREIPAERINYHILAKGGVFYRPGDWRQLDDHGRTARFVDDQVWRKQFEPISAGAQMMWDQELIPPLALEELPKQLVQQLKSEGHRIMARVHLS